ncbi:MFS transporter [Saccharopolyspora dendranthemae]|uniref:Putative proline/betaine transporter n=1 Tax=Saccharopolyspora dendranthemae TaxID=1181886 RepID=A0A561V866_9PSEU|nr:MFS transporter [Saccharopolyspora dendranthemae]TWG07790.1 MHS family proline/betaine transporter-like MFS transporter [Saccharopolyspora dendranthemae]
MSNSVPLPVRRKAVLAASIGNFIEWFEFGLYGFFAAAIAANFFPGSHSLISTFAAFGVSFVLRPLGALIFGHYGDRMGRRTTLSISIIGMSVATFVMGLLPNYDGIGVAAPILLVIARVVQGFSAGGEFGGATAFMVEYAPRHRRTFYGSWQMFTQYAATLVATMIGALLSLALTPEALSEWGWRIPFLVTLPLGAIGLYLRLRLDETPEFQAESGGSSDDRAPLMITLREHWRSVLKVIGLIISGTTCTYMIQAFWPAFLVKTLHIPQVDMFSAMLVGIAALLVTCPAWALLADRIGRRKPFLVASPVSLVVLAVPIYQLILSGSFGMITLAYVLLGLLMAPGLAAISTAIAEAFPTKVRYSGLSLAYSAAVSVFGGSTPLILSALVESTGNPMTPAYYLIGVAAVSALAALSMTDTSRDPAPAEAEAVSAR